MEIKFEIRYLEEVVRKHIPDISSSAKALIQSAIESRLTIDPIGFGKPLRYSLKGHRRLRVSDYRVVYRIEIESKTVIIIAIKNIVETFMINYYSTTKDQP